MNTNPTLLQPLRRRDFLLLAGKGIGLSALLGVVPGCGGGGGNGSDTGSLPTLQVGIPPGSAELHVLKRTSFGATAASLGEIQAIGADAFIEQQLAYLAIDNSAVEAEVAARYPLAVQTYGELQVGFPQNFDAIVADIVRASLFRAYMSPRQLFEVMVEFWSNHFHVRLLNQLVPLGKPTDDAEVIRANALGNFGDMLQASAKSAAMLFYLDNYLNFAAAPQENYARELLELHTVGVGNFSEDDVKEVARCFTGWTFNQTSGEFVFAAGLHDNGAKLVLGNAIPAGGGRSDGEMVLELLAAHPATARNIATKLCRRFVADNPTAALVARIAERFTATNGDITAVLRTLFADAEFRASGDAKLSRPVEFVGQLARSLRTGPGFPDATAVQLWLDVVGLLGQVPFYWTPPDGYPDTAAYWGSTSAFLNRWRIALALNDAGVQDSLPVRQLSGNARSIAATVDAVTGNLLQRDLAASDRQIIIDWLAVELDQSATATLPPATIDAITPLITSLLASSAYFQLR